MSTANRVFLWLLGGLIVIFVAWYLQWFFINHEKVTEEQRIEVSPEAQRNRFLAADRFLHQLGYETESFRARNLISNLPSPADALLVRRMQPEITEQQMDTLIYWIEAGGTLILAPQHFDPDGEISNPFLAELGVRMYFPDAAEEDSSAANPAESDTANSMAPSPYDERSDSEDSDSIYQTVDLPIVGEVETIRASFRDDRFLEDTDQWASETFGSGSGSHYLMFEIDQGQVIVLSDLDLFTNDRIGKLDHAFLLNHFVTGSRKVWLQYSIDTLPLPQLLWQKMPFAVSALVILLLVMGWRLFLFTGPRLRLQNLQRRNLLEHIDASANYAWRIDKGYSLFENNRQALEQAWRKRHPGLNSMDNRQRAEWIGEKTGMVATAVERSLYDDISKDQDFIKATLVLQQLASGLKQRELR